MYSCHSAHSRRTMDQARNSSDQSFVAGEMSVAVTISRIPDMPCRYILTVFFFGYGPFNTPDPVLAASSITGGLRHANSPRLDGRQSRSAFRAPLPWLLRPSARLRGFIGALHCKRLAHLRRDRRGLPVPMNDHRSAEEYLHSALEASTYGAVMFRAATDRRFLLSRNVIVRPLAHITTAGSCIGTISVVNAPDSILVLDPFLLNT